jgi:tetratricopeptide (TPR) repeat protein
MSQVFLSYRRRDNDVALSIYLWLIKQYGREAAFWDRKDIDAGRDFSEVITQGIDKSAALIALIGPDWLGKANARGGRKIAAKDDWVQREIRAALDRRILVLPVLATGAAMPKPTDLHVDLRSFADLQALSMNDMRFYSLLADALGKVCITARDAGGEPQDRTAARAGVLLRRQAERLQIRAKELIREGHSERAIDELNEGIELMMALLDFVPGEQELDVQLGYIYGGLHQEFDKIGDRAMAKRYLDLQLGVMRRVQDKASPRDSLTGVTASAIKGEGEVYANAGDYDRAIEYYRRALDLEPTYHYAWHDLFAAYDGLARRGRVHLNEMRVALKKTREFSRAGPGAQVEGLDLKHLDSLEELLRHWEREVAKHPHLLAQPEQGNSGTLSKRATRGN